MKKIIFLIPFFLFGLNVNQLNILKLSYNIGKKYKAIDGHTFEDTLSAIILTETSAGKYIIGDNYFQTGKEKPLILKSLGVAQVKLETAIYIILKYPKIFKKYKQFIHKNPFIFKKYVKYLINIQYFQNIYNRYKYDFSKRGRKVFKWAKRELFYNKKKMKKYLKYYQKDLLLSELLISDIKFNLTIADLYLITNYNYALKHKMWNPWFKTISKYNGTWKNKIYYKKVIKNMKFWRKIKHKLGLK